MGGSKGRAFAIVVVVVVTVLWLAALLIDGSPTFKIRDAGGGDRFSAQAAECTRDPRTPGYNVWRLHWQAEAAAHVTVHRRTVITAFGGSVEVWARDQESSPTFAGTMEGVTAGDGVRIANNSAAFGFSLQLPTPDARRLCGFSFTLPSGGHYSSTSNLGFVEAADFVALAVGESDVVDGLGTVGQVTVRRIADGEWSIDVRGKGGSAATFKITIRTDSASPPWRRIAVDVDKTSRDQDVVAKYTLVAP